MSAAQPSARAADVVRVAGGNFVEMYDFMVFGYFADAIGAAYFPGGSHLATLLKALATFGVGFLMRPLGAIVLGAFTDRHGRRAGLGSRRRLRTRMGASPDAEHGRRSHAARHALTRSRR